MKKFFNFTLGLFAGAAVGGALALLLAPESGPELQRRLLNQMDELIEEGREAANARQREMRAQLESFKRGTPVTLSETSKE